MTLGTKKCPNTYKTPSSRTCRPSPAEHKTPLHFPLTTTPYHPQLRSQQLPHFIHKPLGPSVSAIALEFFVLEFITTTIHQPQTGRPYRRPYRRLRTLAVRLCRRIYVHSQSVCPSVYRSRHHMTHRPSSLHTSSRTLYISTYHPEHKQAALPVPS